MATYTDIKDLIDANLASGTKIPAIKHREVEMALLDYIEANLAQTGDIKRIKCDLEYYTENFETNGLGKNLREGWAQCIGNNGTDNLTGRVGVGYGFGYSSFGAIGGSKDAVVVEHNHTGHVIKATSTWRGGGDNSGDNATSTTGSISTAGVSGTDKNMQPYIVQLYIMKL